MRLLNRVFAALMVSVLFTATQVWSQSEESGYFCTTRTVEGRWILATGISQSTTGNKTAVGTMTVDSEGNMFGKFDVTVAEVGFFPGNTFWGQIVINPDCTGEGTFETNAGNSRTDSIAVVGNGSEIVGMSRDPLEVWTYKLMRISGKR